MLIFLIEIIYGLIPIGNLVQLFQGNFFHIQNVDKKFRQIDFYLISRDFLKAWFWHGLFSI